MILETRMASAIKTARRVYTILEVFRSLASLMGLISTLSVFLGYDHSKNNTIQYNLSHQSLVSNIILIMNYLAEIESTTA